jgi:deoxyribodipyrimidine photo-lyase
MIVGSFLVKNLLLHWENGERWFWDCLLDADLANNSASWQWIAGCGADAAPYFRIFNPITQGEKFDPQEAYIRTWVPEYGTPAYPAPIVDLKQSRTRALAAFRSLQ